MRYFLPAFLTGILVLSGCGQRSGEGDASFHQLSDKFVKEYLEWRPQTGTSLGLHDYDGRITDVGKTSLDRELKRLKKYDLLLDQFDSSSLSARAFYDFRILRSAIKNEIYSFEDLRTYEKNPMVYAGMIDVNIYIKRNFAPLEERVKSIIAIEQESPSIFAYARENLADTLAKPLVQTAITIANGSASFLEHELVAAVSDVHNDSLMKVFAVANAAAVKEIKAYAEYLKKEKLPMADNNYAIGEENYRKMLLYEEGITLSPERILEIGKEQLTKEQEAFAAAAHIIDPNKKPVDVYHDMQTEHPTAENLIPDVRKNMESIRQFLIDHHIVTMPSNVRVHVEETPQYARETSTASMDTPGPFETKATEAYYYVTPVDPKWTAQQKEDWLRMFDYYTSDNITIHEAYPGHYTQFLHLNASHATKIEKIFGSYAFIEGWAHYSEQMMVDEGFGNDGDSVVYAKHRLAQSGDALLRLCRLCVSIQMHCNGMSLKEGTKFFMDNWYQGEKPSYQEALRGTFDPGYLFYTVGKLEILKLRKDYKKQEGENFSLQKFHDAVLDNGMAPVRMLRERLLKDPATWNDIL